MAEPVRLLVASHDASRTGAPLGLLTFLRWVRRETDAEVQLVLWRGGPLVAAFAEVAEVTVLHPPPGERSLGETVELGLAKLGLGRVAARWQALRVRRRLLVGPHDVLWLNGAGSALVVPYLPVGAPTVAHVHELERGLTFSLRGPGRTRFLGADRIVAVAQRVADHLVEVWGVDRDRIEVIHGCVPDRVPDGRSTPTPPTGREPLVLSVGVGSWRKGIDLFMDLTAKVHAAEPTTRFAWVGPLDDDAAVRGQAERLGVGEVLDLPGEVTDPTPWFAGADVFVSTAREDPFPLVALEAGAAGLAVAAFDSGGISELLADGRGVVVGPEAVEDLAGVVVTLLGDPDRRHRLGAALEARVAFRHGADLIASRLWAEAVGAVSGEPPETKVQRSLDDCSSPGYRRK